MNLTVAFRSGGDVAPCRFVTLAASAFTIQAATANQPPIGVSFSGTREAPVPSASPLLAISGEGCPIWGPGETALLELGGTVTTGALLKSDASGKGVAIASSGTDLQRYGAVALEPGAAGEAARPRAELLSRTARTVTQGSAIGRLSVGQASPDDYVETFARSRGGHRREVAVRRGLTYETRRSNVLGFRQARAPALQERKP